MLWVSSLSSGYLFTHQEGTTHISLYPLLRVMEMLWKRWNFWGPVRWLRGQRCLLHIPSDLGSTPRAHIQVKGENRLHTVVLWPTHMHHGMGVHTDTHVGAGKSLVRKLLLELPRCTGRMCYWLDTGLCQGSLTQKRVWSPDLLCWSVFSHVYLG